MFSDVAIIIPARLNSQRLPNKPLAQIGDYSMIEHVVKNVKLLQAENVYVATDSQVIADKVEKSGGKSILTSSNIPTGTDRVHNAIQLLNNSKIKYVINVQGDMPFIDHKIILDLILYLQGSKYDIVTPVARVAKDVVDSNSNVKAIIGVNNKALYFSRQLIPYGASEFLYHIGVYGFTKEALDHFVQLPKSALEITENLEQLRALENDIDIGLIYADTVPISVDTAEDLIKAQNYYKEMIKDQFRDKGLH